MSPSSSCFSLVTSSTTLPVRTVTLVHLGSARVADTTYLGRLLSRSANSPGLAAHRVPNHSSLRRPSSRAAVPSASAYSIFPHSSRSLPPYWTNQPPRLKPSLPSGSSTTPSSDTFVLITIFPIAGSPLGWCCQPLVMKASPRRESGHPPAAQFAPRPTPVHDGSPARCGRRSGRRRGDGRGGRLDLTGADRGR